jgi:TM2 domain-containing membrane protein YozV
MPLTLNRRAERGIRLPFCPKCGKEVTEEMNVCPYCGNPLKVMPAYTQAPSSRVSVGTKNSGLAAVLSLIIPGVGQMYAGQIGRGLLFLFIGIPLTAIIALFFFWLILPLFLPLAFWIWNIFDAYNLCNEYNRRLLQTGNPPW